MLLKAEGLYVFGPYRLVTHERQLLRNGQIVPLPPRAFDLLMALVGRGGSLVTKEELLADVWAGAFVEEANLPYTISLLRKALGQEERYIETVPKSGYRFIAPVSVESAPAANVPSSNRIPKRLNRRSILAFAVLGLLGASAWVVWQARIPQPPEPITTPITSFGGLALTPRLSPDGRYVTYQWDGRRNQADAVNWDIYVQPVEGAEPFRLTTDPTGEFGSAWSPDGERIAFLYTVAPDRYEIHEVSKSGGGHRTLTPPDVFAAGNGIDWAPDGKSIAFTAPRDSSGRRGLAVLSLETGQVRYLTQTPIDSAVDRSPRFSPDGQTVAFCRAQAVNGDLYVVPVAGGAERRVTSGGMAARGHDWTEDGRELVFSSDRSGYWALWRITANLLDSEARPVLGIGPGALYPSIAKNNGRLVYHEVQGGDQDIWRVPVTLGGAGSTPSIGTPFVIQASTRMDTSPQVSRDGKRLVFVSQRAGDQGIWVSDIDGRQPMQIAKFHGYPAGSPRWSPTGSRIAFDASSVTGHSDIFVVGANGIPQPVPLTKEAADNIVPSWSGNEKCIYFASNRTGRYEVWKVSPDGGKATKVTTGGGFAPFESRDGTFIYYVKGLQERGIWRVPVEGGEETFVVDGPTARFWGYWALVEDGIWFATQEPYRRAPALVEYFDFGSKRRVTVGSLDTQAMAFNPLFAMTPDGKSIVYVKSKPETSDIMLVKNFH